MAKVKRARKCDKVQVATVLNSFLHNFIDHFTQKMTVCLKQIKIS